MINSKAKANENTYLTIVLLILTSITVSCAGMTEGLVQSPRLSVTDVQIAGIQLDRQYIRLKLDITNPNPVLIPVRGFTYKLDINDIEFSSGFNETYMDIPASGKESVDFIISGDLLSFLMNNRIRGSESVRYSLSGDIAILHSSLRFPYHESGIIDISRYLGTFGAK